MYWKHYYDSITVKFNNPFTKISGNKKIGFDGWMKKVMSINNPLVQNKFIAQIIAAEQYAFYNRYRISINGLKLFPLYQLECIDKCTLLLNPRDVDLDSTTEYIVTKTRMLSDKSIEINAVEK